MGSNNECVVTVVYSNRHYGTILQYLNQLQITGSISY